ncbi:MAG TPA: hypothetical protein VGB56_09760 [Flavisolibacter sp.]|jgi:hypothetical protein
MARSNNNIATHGLSGKVGQLVFRQRNGRTFVSKVPRAQGPPSEAQLDLRSRFRQAVLYARTAVADAATKLFYTSRVKPWQTAYNVAFSDFFKTPQIGDIDASAYNGTAGSLITVPVTDDGKVVLVKVKIQKGDGTLVEEGDAVLQVNGLHWVFTAAAPNNSLPGSLITITAFDLPGHSSFKQIIL